jgi:hypothetical protein
VTAPRARSRLLTVLRPSGVAGSREQHRPARRTSGSRPAARPLGSRVDRDTLGGGWGGSAAAARARTPHGRFAPLSFAGYARSRCPQGPVQVDGLQVGVKLPVPGAASRASAGHTEHRGGLRRSPQGYFSDVRWNRLTEGERQDLNPRPRGPHPSRAPRFARCGRAGARLCRASAGGWTARRASDSGRCVRVSRLDAGRLLSAGRAERCRALRL